MLPLGCSGPHSAADISRAVSILGYKPGVDMPEGLRRAAIYYKQTNV